MRRYLGIDPGTTGAFAVLDVHDDGRQELAIIATPTLWMAKGRNGRRRRYDIQTLWARLLACTLASPFTGQEAPMIFAYLEEQSARPQQGVVSMFQTGFGIGMWTALLVAEGIPFATIRPQRWRQRVGLAALPTGTAKTAIKNGVAQVARQRFPGTAIKTEHADAVMLAVAAALEHGTHRATG